MKNTIFILLFALLSFIGCEDVYYAKLDPGGELLVVEARLQAGISGNTVKIFRTIGFYDEESYPAVSGAVVNLIDDKNNVFNFTYKDPGVYVCNNVIKTARQYKLKIQCDGEIYESVFEQAPEMPEIDSVYGELTSKTIVASDYNGDKKIETVDGIQLYADIKNDAPKYYRFYARKILLSTFPFDTILNLIPSTITKYAWRTIYPDGGYNIAAPAKYSSDINIYKHPVEFFRARNYGLMTNDIMEAERGWIYIMYQYSIPVSSYQFYEELNKQLESEGKIFDPIYTQAFGNIKCISNTGKIILGNFEINNFREQRYFLKFSSTKNEFWLRKIETFYDIPNYGIRSMYPPDFWQN